MTTDNCKKCNDCDCDPKEQIPDSTEPYFGKPLPKCPECGMELKGVMGYVCGSPTCPIFPKVTC